MNTVEQTRDKLSEFVDIAAAKGVELTYGLDDWIYTEGKNCLACLIGCAIPKKFNLAEADNAADVLNITLSQVLIIEEGFESNKFMAADFDKGPPSRKPWLELGYEFREKAQRWEPKEQ